MAKKPKSPYEVGREVWVKAKITRVAANPRLPDVTHVTVEMPNGNRETLWIDPDDQTSIVPEKPAGSS